MAKIAISGTIYLFPQRKTFPSFSRGENCDEILEILGVSQWRSRFEHLSTTKTVNWTDTAYLSHTFPPREHCEIVIRYLSISPFITTSQKWCSISRHYERGITDSVPKWNIGKAKFTRFESHKRIVDSSIRANFNFCPSVESCWNGQGLKLVGCF